MLRVDNDKVRSLLLEGSFGLERESLARMGLEVVGLKKRLVDVETQLRRHLARSQGTLDKTVADDLRTLRELEGQIDVTLREVVDTVKAMKAKGL